MADPTYDELVGTPKQDVPTYEELTAQKVPSYEELTGASTVSSPDSTSQSASFDSASVKDMDSLIASERAMTQDFADAKPLISGGAINPAAIGSHILSKLVDNFNTAIGAEAEANQDPEIQKLRQQGESPVIQLPKPELTGVPSGIIRGLETTAETLTTPANLETVAALSAAPAGLTKVAAAGFGLMMAKDVPSKIKAAMSEPSSAGKAQAATEALAEAAMAFFSLKHATKGAVPSFKEWMRQKSGVDIEQPDVSPYIVDSLLLSRQKAMDGIEDVSPGLQDQRREIVKSVNEQLGTMPPELVKARTEQLGKSPPPAGGEVPPVSTEGPPAEGGTASSFTQAVKERGTTQPTETPPPEEPTAPAPAAAETVKSQAEWKAALKNAPRVKVNPDDPTNRLTRPDVKTIPVNAPAGTRVVMSDGKTGALTDRAIDPKMNSREIALDDGTKTEWAPAFGNVYDPIDLAKQSSTRMESEVPSAAQYTEQGVASDKVDHGSGSWPQGISREIKHAVDLLNTDGIYTQGSSPASIWYYGNPPKALPEGGSVSKSGNGGLVRVTIPLSDDLKPDHGKWAKAVEAIKQENPDPKPPSHLLSNAETPTSQPGAGSSIGPGAASAEEPFVTQTETGIKNAITEQKRAEAGLPERDAVAARAFGTIWDEARAAFDKNDEVGTELVDKLKKKARPLTDLEDAILTHEQMDRQSDYDRAVDRVNHAETDADRVDAENQMAKARDALHEVFDVGGKAGTENARGLNARRLMIKQDYTLARMEYRKQAENQGIKLTPEQLNEVKEAHAKIEKLEKQIAEAEDSRKNELAKHYFDQLIKETKKDVKETLKQGKTFTDFTSTQAEKARARIAERRRQGRLNSLPVNELIDHAIIGADYIAKGAKTLVDFTKKMVDDLGESIRPFIDEIFAKSKEFHDSNEKFFTENNKTKPITTEDVLKSAREEAKSGKLDHKTVYDLARAHVNAGVEGFDNVLKAVHADLEPFHKGLTQREVNDAFSEYGKVKFPSKEADKVKLAEYRRIGQLQSAIEDALGGKAPKKTGLQRNKPTIDIRQKMAELKVAMDKAGIETTSPEEQLASRNQARATALRNRIEELDRRLKGGEKPALGTTVPDSAEVEQLRSEKESMEAELKRIEDEANPPKSPEQIRLDAYKKSLQKQIDTLKERTAKGDYAPRPKSTTVLDEGAIKLRAERDAERQKFEEGLIKDRLANRTTATKMADAAVQWSRVVKLASVRVYPKLIQAAAYRAVFEPVSRALGQPLRLINPDVYRKAYPESGASVKAAAKYISTGLTSWGKAWEKLRTGKTNIDIHSDAYKRDAEMLNFVGNSHGMIKEPFRQAIFEANKQLRLEQAIDNGLDVNDPIIQTSILSAAAESANRQIFTGDNPFTRYIVKTPIAALKRSNTAGLPALGRTLEFLMPIVNVPTNIAIHTARLNPLVGFSEFAIRMANASRRGELENKAAKLSNADAELLSRVFKTAALGTVLSAYAWTHPENFGGQFDEKGRKRGGLKPNEVKIFGVTVPGWMNHVGEMQHLNTVASARRVWDRYVHQTGKVDAAAEALAFSMMAPVKTLPFIDTWLRLFSKEKTPGQVAGSTLRDAIVPGVVTQAAGLTDRRDRSPKTFTDELKMPIPKVRESVPAKR